MINVNIIVPEQLPKKSGLVGCVNRHGQVVVVTASRNASSRCEPLKMARAQKAARNGDEKSPIFSRQSADKTDALVLYPEALNRLVFWPMDYELADSYAKNFRKNGQLYIKSSEDENTLIKEQIVEFLKKIRGRIGGTALGLALGMEITKSHRGWKFWNPLQELLSEGIVEKEQLGKEKIYRIAPAHCPTLDESIEAQKEAELEIA